MELLTKQGSQEWFNQRKYRFTSSCVHKLITEPRSKEAKSAGELGETAKSYIMEKVTLEIGGFIPEFENDATEWGNNQEDKTRRWYEQLTGLEVIEIGFIKVNDFYGGSPDNAVIDDSETDRVGGLEIKNPYNSTNHLKHCLIDSAEYFKAKHPEYYWQCISHMITLDTSWCDFVSFDERIDHEIGFFRFRLYKNEEDAKLLLSKIDKAVEYKHKLMQRLGLIPSVFVATIDHHLNTMIVE